MKKLLFTFFALALIAGASAQKPEAVAIKSKGMGLNIDGVLNEAIWAQATKYNIEKPFTGEQILGGAADCSGYFQVAWSDLGLYIAVTVTDDSTNVTGPQGANWAWDMVEIYIDTNVGNLVDAKGPDKANTGHFQIAGLAKDGVVKWGTSSQYAYKTTGSNYIKETFVKWSDLKSSDGKVVTPADAIEIGFDICIVDNDRDSIAKGRNFRDRLVWSNNGSVKENYNNMDDAGILKFDMATVVDNPFVVSAPKLKGMGLNVDGVLNESVWAQVPKIQIEQPFKGESFSGPADCSGYFQTLWNEQGLYIAVTVTDDSTNVTGPQGASWAWDMVEIYLDMNVGNLKDGVGAGANKGHYQIAGLAKDGVVKWGTNSQFAYKTTKSNYVKETFVKWSDLKTVDGLVITPSENVEIGIDICIVDNDRDSIAKGRQFRDRLLWANKGDVKENWESMNDAGILKFDSNTKIENPCIVSTPKLNGLPLNIDGVLDEKVWAQVPKIQIEQPFKGESFSGPADCSGYFQTLWNEQGLYIAVTVTDDSTNVTGPQGASWAWDMVEIYLDMNDGNLKDGVGAGANKGHYQIAGLAKDGVVKWGTNSQFAYKTTKSNYIKETFVKWSDLKTVDGKEIVPSDKVELGFDIYIVDNDRDSIAKGRQFRDRLVWANTGDVKENWESMNDAGILKFDMKTIVENPAIASVSKVTGDTIVVNGILDESVWESAAKVQIVQPYKGEGFTGAADCSGFFQTVWNEKGLYVAVTVTDDISQNDKNSAYGPDWANDMVEIYFDMNEVAKDGLGSKDNKGHYGSTGIAIDGTSKWGASSAYAYKLTGTSYIKESFFAWSDLKNSDGVAVDPKADVKFGFDVYIIDNDRDTVAKARNFRDRLVWSNKGIINENYMNMDDAGTLVLASAAIANVFEYTEPIDTTDNSVDISMIANVVVYPNPAQGTIYLKNVTEKAQVAIFNLDGKLMLNSVGRKPINIQSLRKGIYVVKVSEGAAVINKRIIVQ